MWLLFLLLGVFFLWISYRDKQKRAKMHAEDEEKRLAAISKCREAREYEYRHPLNDVPINRSGARPRKGKSLLEFPSDYVVVDIETTGLSPQSANIIELAAVRYTAGVESGRFVSLINPHFSIPSNIVDLTGITDEMLIDAPDLSDVFLDYLEFLGDSILVAHNANFDINFLYDVTRGMTGAPLKNNFVDTLRIARSCRLPVSNNKLSTLVDYFDIPDKPNHRAADDCVATHCLLHCLKNYVSYHRISL